MPFCEDTCKAFHWELYKSMQVEVQPCKIMILYDI